MKGVVLAGGLGSRLHPLTKVTNKHLLPVYNEPMIYYPIRILVNAGIEEILIVTGGNNAGDFLRLLENGKDFGLKHINYTYQQGEGGIAAALSLAEHFAERDKIAVVLGDNIIEGNIRAAAENSVSKKKAPVYCSKKCLIRKDSACPFLKEKNYSCGRKTGQSRFQLCRDRHLYV